MAKFDETLSPNVAKPIREIQSPSNRFRRPARSARNPDGKLPAPASKVRAEASAPAWAKLKPNDVGMTGNTTTITPLKRCSVICAAELSANRPHAANGVDSALTF